MKIITLNSDDDIISVCDRLDWIQSTQVLFELPDSGGVLDDGLDLVRLRRFADQRRLDIGLITQNKGLARQARALGLPAFQSASEGESKRREWWRGRRRSERVGLPTVGGDRLADWRWDSSEVTEIDEVRQLTPRHWLFRFAAILLFSAALALLVIGFAYTVPRATITLKPQVIPVTVNQQVIADPALAAVNYRDVAMPARLIEVVQSWQAAIETTGTVLLPVAPARGTVVFVNLTDEAVAVPEGTTLLTGTGTRFRTIAPLTMIGVISSTAEIEVVAVDLGPDGNVAANEINGVEGELSRQLQVSNPAPMSGGEVRQVPAVAEQDLSRLRSQVRQFLQAVALADMETRLSEREFLARTSLRLGDIHYELFSHAVGEQTDELRLKTEASLQATAVDLTQASGLVYEALAAKAPAGFSLVASSIHYGQGDVVAVDDDGRVTFILNGRGVIAAELEVAGPLQAITGQAPEYAVAYLYQQMPLREYPAIEIWPNWFRRVPYMTQRLQTEVLAE
jgi:hypothetical protein